MECGRSQAAVVSPAVWHSPILQQQEKLQNINNLGRVVSRVCVECRSRDDTTKLNICKVCSRPASDKTPADTPSDTYCLFLASCFGLICPSYCCKYISRAHRGNFLQSWHWCPLGLQEDPIRFCCDLAKSFDVTQMSNRVKRWRGDMLHPKGIVSSLHKCSGHYATR